MVPPFLSHWPPLTMTGTGEEIEPEVWFSKFLGESPSGHFRLPALAILASGIEPLKALVLSQVALSLQLPFTVLPPIVFTGSKAIVGEFQNGPVTRIVAEASTTVLLVLNGALLVLTLAN